MKNIRFFLVLTFFLSIFTQSNTADIRWDELDKPLSQEEEQLLSWPWYDKYEYFQRAEEFPFNAKGSVQDLNNAYTMIEASILAYSKTKTQKRVLEDLGMKYHLFEGKKSGTQGYLAWNSDAIWVVFRGTEPLNPTDWMTDLNYKLIDSGQGGQVHRGFKAALDEVWLKISLRIRALSAFGQRKVWFTGHSLGSALALIAADRWGSSARMISFGSPRVGDRNFYRDFVPQCSRFVNNLDIITHIPPHKSFLGEFYHVGELIQFDADGNMSQQELVDETKLLEYLGFFDKINKLRFLRMFLDHIPHRYSERILQNLDNGVRQLPARDSLLPTP